MVNLLEICIFAPLFRKSITESRCNFNGYIISSNFSFWRSSPVLCVIFLKCNLRNSNRQSSGLIKYNRIGSCHVGNGAPITSAPGRPAPAP